MAVLGFQRFRVLRWRLRFSLSPSPPPSPSIRKLSIRPIAVSISPSPLIAAPFSIMEWTCSLCTLHNSDGDSCGACEAPRDPAAGAAAAADLDQWSCAACTFLCPGSSSQCGICGTERPVEIEPVVAVEEPVEIVGSKVEEKEEVVLEPSSKRQRVEKEEEAAPPKDVAVAAESQAPSPNALLRQLHMERMSRKNSLSSSAGVSTSSSPPKIDSTDSIVLMTYNVWFREDLELERRMEAIGNLVRQHQPHIICFQEVTTTIYTLFARSSWWNGYRCSVSPDLAAKRAYFCIQLSKLPVDRFYRNPFPNTIMSRELCLADIDCGDNTQLVVATTHLESPCPAPPKWDQMFSAERVVQMKESVATLKSLPNVVFGGDMNWDDKLDGQPPLDSGWADAWTQLRPNEPGLTYDGKANPMLTGSRLQKRLDRVFYRFTDFEVESIEMIGTKPIPGLTFDKETKKATMKLPVLPSDHFGLVLKIRKKK